MTTPVFPSGLPRPRTDGFEEAAARRFESFAVDRVGQERRRAVTTAAPRRLALSYTMTAAQWVTLMGFFETDTRGGALRFTFTHPVTGVTALAYFETEPRRVVRPGTPRFNVSFALKFYG